MIEQEKIDKLRDKFQKLNNKEDISKFIISLYTEDFYSYRDIAFILCVKYQSIISFFERKDIKVCRNENCLNNSRAQTRSNFSKDPQKADGLKYYCKKCERQYSPVINKKLKGKLKHLIQGLNDQQILDYIINLRLNYNYSEKKISYLLDLPLDYITNLFKNRNIKICSKEDCLNNNRLQSRENFEKSSRSFDGLKQPCKSCIREREKEYQQRNKNEKLKRHRDYIKRTYEYRNNYMKEYRYNNKEELNKKQKEYHNSFVLYNRFVDKISYAEETRQDPSNPELLQVKCTYCNSWFNPLNKDLFERIKALKGLDKFRGTENRLYCSNECKKSCPIYKQIRRPKNDSRNVNNLGTSREVQSELRQLVFERDNWICQKCSTYKENLAAGVTLHCHHKEGIKHEPIESADTDMCITVCSECHKKIHQIPGCTTNDLKCA